MLRRETKGDALAEARGRQRPGDAEEADIRGAEIEDS